MHYNDKVTPSRFPATETLTVESRISAKDVMRTVAWCFTLLLTAPLLAFASPDLTGTIAQFKHKVKESGDKLKIVVRACNVGEDPTPGPFTISMLLSEDGIRSDDDVPLLSVIKENPLNPGECEEKTLKVTEQPSMAGKFALIVIDSEEDIEEGDETNNTLNPQGGASAPDVDEPDEPIERPIEELGLILPPVDLDLTGLTQEEINQVARGSYIVNGTGDCVGCHSTEGRYLGGGNEFPLFPDSQGFSSVFTRNLTPDPETGLQLTQEEFIEALRTGKDFTDSTDTDPQRLIIMPWHIFRFMATDDLEAIYAYLQAIPPVRNEIRKTFIPPFPFPPVPFPALGDGDPVNDPNNAEWGLRIPEFSSSGPDAETFVTAFNATVAGLSPDERAKVGRGSYLVNAAGPCILCHTDGDGDGMFDDGLIPETVDINMAAYLAGGVDLGPLFGLPGSLFSRNLTPDRKTGLFLTEEQFIEVLRTGIDFRRSEGTTLKIPPHFPTEFRHTLDDLKAIYAYLRSIPKVRHEVEIVP